MPGRKKYSPPRTVTNRGRPAKRRGRDGVLPGEVPPVGTRDRVGLVVQPVEVRQVQPLALHELELAVDVRHEEEADEPALAVVGGARRQLLPVRQAAAQQHPVAEGGLAGARSSAADVRAAGAGVAHGVVGVVEPVVVRRAGEERVVGLGREGDGGPAGPAADHPGREELTVTAVAQPPAEGADMLLQLAVDRVGAVAPEHVGDERGRGAGLVGVAEHELARRDGEPVRVRGVLQAAAPDRGLRDPVPEAEVLPVGRLIAAEGGRRLEADAHQAVGGGARLELDDPSVEFTGRERRDEHDRVHAPVGEGGRGLPVRGQVRAGVAQPRGRTGGHPLPEVVGEAGERRLRDAQPREPRMSQPQVHAPGRLGVPLGGGRHGVGHRAQPRACGRRGGEAVEQVDGAGHPVGADHEPLDVGDLESVRHVAYSFMAASTPFIAALSLRAALTCLAVACG